MANEGIFITQSGVVVPALTEMSLSNWQSYANDLNIGMLQSATLVVNAFEAFKFRAHVLAADDIGADPTVTNLQFNGNTVRTLQFLTGAGTAAQTSPVVTVSAVPAEIEVAARVYLAGANFEVGADPAFDLAMSIRSLDGDSHSVFNFQTQDTVYTKDGSVFATENTYTGLAASENVQGQVTAAAIRFVNVTDASAVIYSIPRTFQLVRTAGTSVLFASSGTGTGTALPFTSTETINAQALNGASTVEVRSNFGQVTVYTVTVGLGITVDSGVEVNGDGQIVVEFQQNTNESHDITDDFNNGVGDISYEVISGTLPAGMSINSSGFISGIPTQVLDNVTIIKLTDEAGGTINLAYEFKTRASASFTYTPTNGSVGVPYSYTPPPQDITGAVIVSGVLPVGVTINSVSGVLSGTPTTAGNYSANVAFVNGSGAEGEMAVNITVYNAMEVEVVVNLSTTENVGENATLQAQITDPIKVNVIGGSGEYQYSITGDNMIDSNGNIQMFEAGTTTVTVIDLNTGEGTNIKIEVAGQSNICGLALSEEEGEQTDDAPCVDIITDCNTPVNVAFSMLHILTHLQDEVKHRVYPTFNRIQSAKVTNNGKPFVMFRSSAANGFAVSDTVKSEQGFIVEFGVSASLASNLTGEVAIGVAKKFDVVALQSLEFSAVFYSSFGTRHVGLRKDNVIVGGAFPILEGQQVSLGVFGDSVTLYIDGILRATIASTTFSCSGLELIFMATTPNVIIGGKAENVIYDVETAGTAGDVGSVDAQSGRYTPSLNNVGFVIVGGVSTANPAVKYLAKIRVIRPAVRTSLEKAMIEGIPVDFWIADTERGDDLPLRLNKDGMPDRNQIFNPYHLGVLAGSGKIEASPTRNDFRNDVGATSTSLTIDKVTITGGFLAVRDMSITKRLIPYMKEYNSHGIRQLKQFSTGCHKKMRVLMVWQSPECGDLPVYDAIEVSNALSYTSFNLEVGKGVQTNIPLTIEGFPDKDGVIFAYNQYDKHFHRIGEEA